MSVTGDPLFTFAVVADTHMRPEDGDESSPWAVNAMANDRARHVVALLNHLDPDFIIHIGDIVHPVPVLSTYVPACAAAKAELGKLEAPVHYLPGNHDVGDKPNPQMPAGGITDANMDAYEAEFGDTWLSFDANGCHFTLINAQLLNSGLDREAEQAAWLEKDLKAHEGKRIFLFIHYPPCIRAENEPSNYDNIDEPARTWLLDLIKAHSIEAMFCGHVHGFFYNRHGDTESYILPSTAFFRQDYSELFRIEAADEYGRNDAEKLGFFMVSVHADGHVAKLVRTNGAGLAADAPPPDFPERLQTLHTREATEARVGVHLRHPWAEETELPYNGPMDEFHRKRVRNDYTLMALWDLGIRDLRVPLPELLDERIRTRIGWMRDIGHRFGVFCFGVPDGAAWDALLLHRELIESVEFVLPWAEAEAAAPALAELKAETGLDIVLTKIETSADKKAAGSRFSHFVAHGFRASESGQIDSFRDAAHAHAGAVDAYVFRVALDRSPFEEIKDIHAWAADAETRAVANIRLASENPAEYVVDDERLANHVAEAVLAGYAFDDVAVYIDTFMDLDRGYFPRHGLFDRRFNPRPAAFVFRHLQSLILTEGEGAVTLGTRRAAAGGAVVEFELGIKPAWLMLPGPGKMDAGDSGVARPVRALDLVSGVIGPETDVIADGIRRPTVLIAE